MVPACLRSVLYVPGSNPRALGKIPTLSADAFILDLEDAVAPEAKVAARGRIRDALEAGLGRGRTIAVRINGLTSPWGPDDLEALMGRPDLAAVVLPKCEQPRDIRQVRAALGPQVGVWCMIETPLGVLRADALAAEAGVDALVMGTSDLSRDLRAGPHPERLPLLHALSTVVLAARAHGRLVLDGVCLELDAPEVFEAEARQGRALGFDGKTLIHPGTIAATHAVFSPDAAEVDEARRVVVAFEQARARGEGVCVYAGRLVEQLHVDAARALLAQAAFIAGRAG